MADDDGLVVHAQLVFHEGQPDGSPGRDGIRHVPQLTSEPGELVQPLVKSMDFLIILREGHIAKVGVKTS